jgi:hypothetical protein
MSEEGVSEISPPTSCLEALPNVQFANIFIFIHSFITPVDQDTLI